MLDKEGVRQLAYVVLVDEIRPIPNYDRVEHARVGGWWVIVQKGQFNVGDPAIYFEIDSKVPSDKECFAFLEKRNYKVKTLRMCKVISQGLLMHPSDFSPNWYSWRDDMGHIGIQTDDEFHYVDDESRFLTKKLGVTYAEAEDNQRKAPSVDKYKKMAQRHPAIFRKPFVRWLMKHQWGKDLMFLFFGKKKDKKNGWPSWVAKTDEERIENCTFYLQDKEKLWIATEKVDGSSTTFTMRRNKRNKYDFYVCSRNVCFDSVDKPCYYDTNIYWEMAQKYDMYNVLKRFLEGYPEVEWVTIQGETYGEGVQKNTYDLKGHDFKAFNLIDSVHGRWNSSKMKGLLEYQWEIPCVPILDGHFTLPDTVEELREYVNSQPSTINGKMKEGIVFRSQDGIQSFKCVSPEYLLLFHQ